MDIKTKLIENKHEITDIIYLVALQGLNFIAPILVLPYLMVVLGAEKFGYISFALAVCQYLNVAVDFGFYLSTTKRIALVKDDKAALSRIFSAAFYCKMGLLVLSFIVLAVIAAIPKFAVYRPALFAMFTMVVGNAFLFAFLFQGLGQIRWVSIFNGIAKMSVLPLTFVFVKNPDDYLIAALLQGGVSIVAAIISLLMIVRKRWLNLPRFCMADCKTEMKEGFPIFISNASGNIYVFGFVLILGIFATPDEVGRYAASDKIIRALIAVTMAPVIQAFYPSVVRMAATGWQKAKNTVNLLLGVLLVGMFAIIIAVFAISPYLPDLLGNDYTGTETIIRILSFATVFITMGGICGQLGLLAMGGGAQKKSFSKVYVGAAVVALTSVLVLSPFYQGIGAAIAILLTEAYVGITMLVLYVKMLRSC